MSTRHRLPRPNIQQKLGGKIGSGEQIHDCRTPLAKVSNEAPNFQRDGVAVHALLQGRRPLPRCAVWRCFAMYTPGHTPPLYGAFMGNAVHGRYAFHCLRVALARADFPVATPESCMTASKRYYPCPKICACSVCHDYAQRRDIQWETTVGDEKAHKTSTWAAV